jgi:ribosomal protein S18 acetylase RimI-like enzyme
MKQITFRRAKESDRDFLYSVYRSTRINEPGICTWEKSELETFLQQQFTLQHTQYRANYPKGEFTIILADGTPAGRLYVNHGKKEIRIIDIALLPSYRMQGIGSHIIKRLIIESDQTGIPLTLYVEYNNPIKAYYIKMGFKKKREYGVYHYMEREVS